MEVLCCMPLFYRNVNPDKQSYRVRLACCPSLRPCELHRWATNVN